MFNTSYQTDQEIKKEMKLLSLLEYCVANVACWTFISIGSAIKVASDIEPILKDLSWLGGILVSALTIVKFSKKSKK